ncbi:MAG: NUDIX hydrolase [Propionicimonas sp.]
MPRELQPAELVDIDQHWPVVSHQVLGRGSKHTFVSDTVLTPGGATMQREYILHPGAVGIIAWDDRDRIAVVLQYRHPVAQRLVEPPAGLLDQPGEHYLIGAQRELAEEVGLQASDWRVLVDLLTSPGASQESVRILLARGLTQAEAPADFVASGEEAEMEFAWAQRADLVAAILAGRVQNPLLVAGVLALETARLTDGVDHLRAVEAPWPVRATRDTQNQALADVDGSR